VEDKTRIKFGLIENVEIYNLRMIEKDFKTTDGLLSNTELHPESFESWKKGKINWIYSEQPKTRQSGF
jgi:hypothetical protein